MRYYISGIIARTGGVCLLSSRISAVFQKVGRERADKRTIYLIRSFSAFWNKVQFIGHHFCYPANIKFCIVKIEHLFYTKDRTFVLI